MEIHTIGVVGAGQMGSGIAEVASAAGYAVLLHDIEERFLERGLGSIRRSLAKAVEKGKRTSKEAESILDRIEGTTDLGRFHEADLVIEAIVEDVEEKRRLLSTLDSITRPGTLLATNTSSISVTLLGSSTKRPDRVAGMHFFNPVPVMKLVELVRGLETSPQTISTLRSVGERMGKTVVEVRDFPGFVSNRVLMPMINEAIFALQEGVASAEEIDSILRLGMNHPMGPLELADFIGLDTCRSILEVLQRGFGDPKYRPAPLLTLKVQAGHLGRKSGRGFYRYDEKGNKVAEEPL